MTRVRAASAAMLLAFAAAAAADDLHLSVLETDQLRLIYFDPAQTYLVPHVVRSFHNSLDWQRRVFGWQPYEKVTLLLKDFTDSGNAAARSSPNDAISVDIAPLSRTFETFTSSERVFMLMNHELVHVVTMDQWAKQDDFWRRVFAGKLNPEEAHPETLLYSYLTVPRVTVPRWYLEGSAVFMETWRATLWLRVLAWRGEAAARRAPTTRWCFGRWCATARASTTRSGWCRSASSRISRSA